MKIKFGTDGFRGYIGKDFTFEKAIKVAQMALTYFKSKDGNSVSIGYDTRFLSKEVAQEISHISKASGYKVLLANTFVPSPALSLYTYSKKLNFGFMITASHNPPQFNGIKIKENFGGSALSSTMEGISKAQINLESKEVGDVISENIRSFYLESLKKAFPSLDILGKAAFKILVNPMYGASQGYLPELFKKSSIQIVEMNNIINPAFGGTNPEPTEENLKDTRKRLLKEKFNLAFAFDGDGDRISVFDERGNFYSTQKLLPLFLYHFIKKGLKGMVIKTVSTTSLLSIMAKKNNLPFVEVPIGFKNIVPYFLQKKALIGGEESGGMVVKGYIPERDGLYSALMLLKILGEEKKSLFTLYSEIEDIYGKFHFKREDYHFKDEGKVRKMLEKIDFSKVASLKVVEKNFLDGKKFILSEKSFLLIRISGTEPVVRVYAEAETGEKLDEIFSFARNELKKRGVEI